MSKEFLKLQKQISLLNNKGNFVSILIYGAMLLDSNKAKDLDIVIVVKKVNAELSNLFNLLEKYKNLDFNIYTYDEITNNLSYYTREFKLEYLSKGLCIYGKNIFYDEFLKVSDYQYKQSILIRSIEHLQIVRQKYFSNLLSEEKKFLFLEKYFLRISKNILLFKGVEDHTSVNNLSPIDIFKKLVNIKMFDYLPELDNIKNSEQYFSLFSLISEALIICKKDFDLGN